MTFSMNDIKKLSVADRIRLVGDIWDTIASSSDHVEQTEAQRYELNRRLDEYSKIRPLAACGALCGSTSAPRASFVMRMARERSVQRHVVA